MTSRYPPTTEEVKPLLEALTVEDFERALKALKEYDKRYGIEFEEEQIVERGMYEIQRKESHGRPIESSDTNTSTETE